MGRFAPPALLRSAGRLTYGRVWGERDSFAFLSEALKIDAFGRILVDSFVTSNIISYLD